MNTVSGIAIYDKPLKDKKVRVSDNDYKTLQQYGWKTRSEVAKQIIGEVEGENVFAVNSKNQYLRIK